MANPTETEHLFKSNTYTQGHRLTSTCIYVYFTGVYKGMYCIYNNQSRGGLKRMILDSNYKKMILCSKVNKSKGIRDKCVFYKFGKLKRIDIHANCT